MLLVCIKIVTCIGLFFTYAGSTDTVKMGPHLEPAQYDHEAQANGSWFELTDDTKNVSKRSADQLVAVVEFKNRCLKENFVSFADPHYPYQPTNEAYINEMFSQTRAFLSAFSLLMNQRDRDFDADDHFSMGFLAILPISCFETAYLMQSSFPDYGRHELLTAQYNREHEFLRRNNKYAQQRRILRDRYVDKFRFMNKSETTTLQELCKTFYEPFDTAIPQVIGTDAAEALAQEYDLEKFNGIIKIFLEDILSGEIIRQACIALTGQSKIVRINFLAWNSIRVTLAAAQRKLRTRWMEAWQEKKDVMAAQLTTRFSELTRHSTHEPAYNQEISDMLTQKYYDFTFRVTFYAGWTLSKARVICINNPNLNCIMKNDKLVVVSWKPRFSLQSTYISVTDRDDYPPLPELPLQFRQAYTESMLAHVYAASGYLRNLHKRNVYPALKAYVTGGRNRRVTMSEISDILQIFRDALDTTVSIKTKFTRVCRYVKQVPHYRAQRDASIDHLETIFFEMNTRYENIHETLKPIMTHYRSKYATAADQLEQLTDAVRQQFHTYYENTRLYLQEDISNDDRKKLLEPFLQACTKVMEDIQKLTDGLSNGKTFMETLSNESPMHAMAYLLVRLHDQADLMVYGMQCTFQGHRYAIDPIYARTQDQIYEEIRRVEGNELNMSRNIGDAMEHITKYAANAKYYWQVKVRQELDKENSIQATNDTAQRIANRLEQTFPWNKFAVTIYGTSGEYNSIPGLDESIGGEMFFNNPDYSMVYKSGGKVIIVNWDLRSESEPESLGFAFSNSMEVCVTKFQSIIYKLSSTRGAKSLFIWRTYTARYWASTPFPHFFSNNCCGSSTSYKVHNVTRKCWYPVTPVGAGSDCVSRTSGGKCNMMSYQAGIYVIGNNGEGY